MDEQVQYDEEDTISKADMIESEEDLENNIINKDWINNHNNRLTQVERFIQQKYYEDGASVVTIIKVYQPFHLIKDEKTIRKILKK